MISNKEYLHSSVLWLRILEPYVPLRNATKRKRLQIGYICRNYNMVYMSGVNSNSITATVPAYCFRITYYGTKAFAYVP
jgi:hypothetical protein